MSQHDGLPTNKQKRSRRDRTEEILAVTTELFGEYGFQGTTLAMVAKAVGLTEAGVLHYFPSKVHLLQGVLEHRDQKDAEKYAALIDVEKESFAELFKLLEAYYADDKQSPALAQLFIVLVAESMRSEHPSHDFFVDRYQRMREKITHQLQMIDGPTVRKDVNMEELAMLIVAVLDGLRIQWLLAPEQVDFLAPFQLFCKLLLEYLEE